MFRGRQAGRLFAAGFTAGTLSARRSVSTTHPSLRVAQNCGTTAFFVAHNNTGSLRVFRWPEASATPTAVNVPVASWSRGPYASVTPDGRKWLDRADGRHTGATVAGNELWFAWGSAACARHNLRVRRDGSAEVHTFAGLLSNGTL